MAEYKSTSSGSSSLGTDLSTPSANEGGRWLSLPSFFAASALGMKAVLDQPAWRSTQSTAMLAQEVEFTRDPYTDVSELCVSFGRLEQEDPLFLEPETVQTGSELLNKLDALRVPAPQAFSHGGDALVLKWRFGDATDYLTVCDDYAVLLSKSSRADLSERTFNLKDTKQVLQMALRLGGKIWTRQTNT